MLAGVLANTATHMAICYIVFVASKLSRSLENLALGFKHYIIITHAS